MDNPGTLAEVHGPVRSIGPGTAQTPTFLYRFFDRESRLLYVGITYHVEGRFDKHRYEKAWAEIASVEIAQYPSRAEALEAEQLAIKAEAPAWNVIHNSERPAPQVRTNIANGDWWMTRRKIAGFRCEGCGREFEDKPAVMRYVKDRDYTTRLPTLGTHRWNWSRHGWCLWLEHDQCGWSEHRIYITDQEIKDYDRIGGGWENIR